MKVIGTFAQFITLWWSLSSAFLFWVKVFRGDVGHWALTGVRWVWAELRPFYLPAALVYIGHMAASGEMHGWNIISGSCALLSWWLYKDIDDDDRWKRRKAKLAAKVGRQGARLVVLPVTGGQR